MSFGSFLRGIGAQINPFDRGRTYSSVQDEERRKREAQRLLQGTRAQTVLKPSGVNKGTQLRRPQVLQRPVIRQAGLAPPRPQARPQPQFNPLPRIRVTNTVKRPSREELVRAAQEANAIAQANTNPGFFTKIRKYGAASLADESRDMARSFARVIPTAAESVEEVVRPGKNKPFDPRTNRFTRFLYGDEPVESYQKRRQGNEAVLENSRFRGVAGPLSWVSMFLTAATDLPLGGGKAAKSSIQGLVKATTRKEVAKVIKKSGVKLSDDALEAIAKTQDDNLIKAILESETKAVKKPAKGLPGKIVREEFEGKPIVIPKPREFEELKRVPVGKRRPSEPVPITTPGAPAPAIGRSRATTAKTLTPEEARELSELDPEAYAAAASEGKILVEPPTIKAAERPVEAVEESPVEQVVKQLPPAVKTQIDDVARQLGMKNSDELVKVVSQPKAASNIAENTPANANQVSKQLEELSLGKGEPSFTKRPLGQLAEKLSINRQLRKVTRPVERVLNQIIRGSLESGSRTLRTPGRVAVGVSRQAGRTPEEIARVGRFQGEKQLGDIYGRAIKEQGDEAAKIGVRRDAVAEALDPQLTRAQGKRVRRLSPDEKAEADYLRSVIDATHEGNFRLGMIDEGTYKKNKGNYFPRDFTEFFQDDAVRRISKDNKLELNIFKNRKDLSDIPKEVLDSAQKDPYYMAALRVQQFQRNKAVTDYSNWLSKNGSLSPGPRKGFIEVPDSPAYGALRGKHVLKEQLEDLQGFIYETSVAQQAMGLLQAYDRFPLRKARKSLLTVFNPGVRVGNRTFNNLMASMNGINPLTFNRNWAKASRMIKHKSPEYVEATKEGIFGSSIIDKELYRGADDLGADKSIIKKGLEKVSESYSKVDDSAKMSAYLTFRERGLSASEAAARTGRFLQNYDMVGQLFDIGAKTPALGNAFVRFSSELMRLAHNTAVDNPARAAGAVMSVAAITSIASKLSGETPEDKATREGRVGAPRVPFTDQSLEIQTPWGAVNAGRLLGVTTYNDLVGGVSEDIKRLSPFQSPVRRKPDGGFGVNVQALAADPLIGPFVSLLADEDFRGKPIADPDEAKYPSQPLPNDEKNKNRMNFLKMSYAPLSNEVDSLVSAFKGKPNYYGKERTPVQAGLRSLGVKIEQFGPEQAQEARGKEEYFSGEFARAGDFLRKNPDLAPAYNAFKGREKVRNGPNKGKRFVDIVTPERWKLVSADQSGRLYDFLRREARTSNEKDGQPIDPIYKLPKERARQALELRSRPTGDDVETEEILRATQPWYRKFEANEREYYSANNKYFKNMNLPDTQAARAKEYAAIKYPEQGKLIQQYYKVKNKSPEAARDFFKRNADKLSVQFDTYREQRLKYINAKRRIEGFPPIEREVFDNVTFGYENDEEKVYKDLAFGRGFAFSGSSGGRRGRGRGNSGSGGAGAPSVDITNFIAALNGAGFKAAPQIRRKPTKVRNIPAAPSQRRIDVSSLVLPNRVPSFKVGNED